MQTHTIEVTGVPDDLLTRLDRRMREQGRDRSQFIRELIEQNLEAQEQPDAGMAFREIVAPLQEDFEATGMTDEQLGELIDAEIKGFRAERRANARPSNG
jgi:predicted DNA-binding protein